MEKRFEKTNQMVVLSSENQVVNFIPIKYLLEQNKSLKLKVHSLCVESESVWNRQVDWHENLKIVIENNYKDRYTIKKEKIKVQNNSVIPNSFFQELKKITFDDGQDDQVVWNITGGQRNLVLAVLNFISVNDARKNDIIIYFDGNTDEIYLYEYMSILADNGEFKSINILEKIKGFFIETDDILKLNGFKETEKNKFLSEKDLVEDYGEIYEKLCNETKFRKEFILLNKKESTLNKDKMIKEMELSEKSYLIIEKEMGILEGKNKNIGNLFEKIIFWKLLSFKKKQNPKRVYKMYCNYKVWDSEKETHQIDEIDILIVLRTGKMIILELKTGAMGNKDESKSTIFTAKFLSGVYGIPLLVLPIVATEKDKYTSIKSTIKQAKRCDLERVYVDEIENKIKEIIKE